MKCQTLLLFDIDKTWLTSSSAAGGGRAKLSTARASPSWTERSSQLHSSRKYYFRESEALESTAKRSYFKTK